MRLEMSKRTDLALKALAYLQIDGEATGRNLAEAIGTTLNYLPQVLKSLTTEGWVVGTPGPGGGYLLRADLAELSVLDVIRAVEGELDQQRCVLRGAPCPAVEPCALHNSWVRARGALLEELGAMPVRPAIAPAPGKGE